MFWQVTLSLLEGFGMTLTIFALTLLFAIVIFCAGEYELLYPVVKNGELQSLWLLSRADRLDSCRVLRTVERPFFVGSSTKTMEKCWLFLAEYIGE